MGLWCTLHAPPRPTLHATLHSGRTLDVCVRLVCVYVVLCVASGLATRWLPLHGGVPTVYRLRYWKSGQVPTKGCRVLDREIMKTQQVEIYPNLPSILQIGMMENRTQEHLHQSQEGLVAASLCGLTCSAATWLLLRKSWVSGICSFPCLRK
jgi:hypothetical protein